MKIFITGGTGFLGKTIIKKLLSEKNSITVLVLPSENPEELSKAGAEIIRGDITNTETLKGKTKNHDAVIHLAGAVGYGQSFAKCNALNRDGTFNVAEEAINSGVKRFVHMSSVSVYGRVTNTDITEDCPLKKIGDPYGDTKIDAENILSKLSSENKLDLTMIRPTMIYGPGDNLFLPKVIENISGGSARIIGDGNNPADLIHVNDVAEFICLVLQKKESVGRIYNLTNPVTLSWKELFSEVALSLNIPKPEKHISYKTAWFVAGLMELVSFFTRKPPRLSRYGVRNVGLEYRYKTDQMQKELGFIPKTELTAGIRECVNNYKKEQAGK